MKTFLEIGSCDFDNLIYLSDKGWRGIVVEPVKEYLDNLPKKDNVVYLNYALDTTIGKREFYEAPREWREQDRDFKGMGTLVPYAKETHTIKSIVETITWEYILNTYKITQIDYLKIDTEGYDYILLKNYPFNKVMPKYIKFEIMHIQDNYSDLLEYLTQIGYHVETDKLNAYCILI
jgi:FkbM family methyltransferase